MRLLKYVNKPAFLLLAVTAVAGGTDTPVHAQTTLGTGVSVPYIYRKWKQFTVEDGLPNDHIFAVKADGGRVWIGTEPGDARQGHGQDPELERAGRLAVARSVRH